MRSLLLNCVIYDSNVWVACTVFWYYIFAVANSVSSDTHYTVIYDSNVWVACTVFWYYIFAVANSVSSDTHYTVLSFIGFNICFLWTSLCLVYIPYYSDVLQGSSRLCNWLSLWRFVPWINHLPPVCWSTFWKSSLKLCRFVSLT